MTGASRSDGTAADEVRGFERLGDPRVWGTTIGAAGGTVFVLVNRGTLADPWPVVAGLAWAVALAAYVWFVLLARRVLGPIRPIRRFAGLVYLGSVVGMLVLIRVGSLVLDEADRSGLRPALIVVAVGLHFLPFASAFNTPMFRVLGSLMMVLGAVGLAAGWAGGDQAAAWAAVTSGVVMLLVISADAARAGRS